MKRANPERALHKAVVDLLDKAALPGVVYFHVPNGGRMHPRRGKMLKEMGVKPGVADLVFLTPSRKMPCFLELKSKKGVLSDAQLDFGLTVKLLGCRYEIARSLDEAKDFLSDIGAIRFNPEARLSIKKRAA